MNENFDAFDNYAMKYDMNEKMIEYKYNHSYRVVHQAEEICRSLNLDTKTRDLASLIALLHDIARFEQYTKFKSFNDRISFDHGQRGVEILFDENEINNFIVDKSDYEIIKKSIFNHNKLSIDYSQMTEDEALQTKIIRDADKIDILYAFSTNRLIELVEDDKDISENVYNSFMKHETVLKSDLKSKNDEIVLFMSLIYDFNFDYSIERVFDEQYIDKIYEYLKNKKIFKPFVDEANKFLKGKMKYVRK